MKSDYAAINGLNVYYEIHSANLGPPALVLLHGGGDTIRTSICNILPELSRNRQVIAFEQQGYGHTSDIADRPFSFEQSADDTAALLEHLYNRAAGREPPSASTPQARHSLWLFQPRRGRPSVLERLCYGFP